MLEGAEAWQRLRIMTQAKKNFQVFAPLSDLQEDGHLVAPAVGTDDEPQYHRAPSRSSARSRVLVVTREAVNELLDVQAELVTRLIDGEMFALGHR